MENIKPQIEESWKAMLEEEFRKDYFIALKDFLVREKQKNHIYPPGKEIFSAFNHTPFESVKVVILGQDPYHGHGQAHGLCFSVPEGITRPPSLLNIFKEINPRPGLTDPHAGKSGKVGEARCTASQCYPHSTGQSGRIAPGKRMGNIY
jgi:uracil-DNA glycosylase